MNDGLLGPKLGMRHEARLRSGVQPGPRLPRHHPPSAVEFHYWTARAGSAVAKLGTGTAALGTGTW